MTKKLAEVRKALIAAATPGITLLVTDLSAELGRQSDALIALVVTIVIGWVTYRVPNGASVGNPED